MFNEDAPHIGAFNFRLIGFKKQPTDHYIRPYMLKKTQGPSCISTHKIQLEWTKEFLNSYEGSPKFAMFYNKVGHDQAKDLQNADNDFREFLQDMYFNGILNHSLVVIFGDHGSRFGSFRQTVQVS
jgi:hypothetical protein